MTYRHPDSSFSAFGPNSYSNETGGTWLTAFVLRCLADSHASRQIEIDTQDLIKSSALLLARQDEDGSFRQEGAKLYSSALAGGLKKDQKTAGLSAYVLVALVKAANAIKGDFYAMEGAEKKLDLAYMYLKNSIEKNLTDVDTYTLALSLYAFKIHTVSSEFSGVLERELDRRAVHRSGQIYWQEADQQTGDMFSESKSADLEITSYVLLAKLYGFKEGEKLGDAMSIAKWINSQRNSLGGFYSTQDTVVALDALSTFASVFYMSDINLKLDYRFNEESAAISIDNNNRLLVQKLKLYNLEKPGIVNRLSFDVQGYGSALVQVNKKNIYWVIIKL